MTLSAAKKLFFEYDGSRFYMSRDDVEAEYLAYGVSQVQEAEWRAEITEQKLKCLSAPGNYRVVSFLCLHPRPQYLEVVLRMAPLGRLTEKCIFLEELVRYAEICRHQGCDAALIAKCREFVHTHAIIIQQECKSAEEFGRVESIIAVAESRRFKW